MKQYSHYSLAKLNGFAVQTISSQVYFPSNLDELSELVAKLPDSFYVLGEGTNTLFTDDSAPVIVKPNFRGITVTESELGYVITAGCAENWHELVCYCLDRKIAGLENLALIPGSVGAAPVQNIGAYGVEIADVLENVTWFDFVDKEVKQFNKQDCQFAYRESIFKRELLGRGVIIQISLFLPKKWQAKLAYGPLQDLDKNCSAQEVCQQVIAIRQAKLPDPKLLPNCGSFFKNPLVNQEKHQQLSMQYPNMPAYSQESNQVKLAAGWLIEQAGLKGFKVAGVGVHDKQALVLVNYHSTSGQEVLKLAQQIQAKVMAKFDIMLEPEVRLLNKNGLINDIVFPKA